MIIVQNNQVEEVVQQSIIINTSEQVIQETPINNTVIITPVINEEDVQTGNINIIENITSNVKDVEGNTTIIGVFEVTKEEDSIQNTTVIEIDNSQIEPCPQIEPATIIEVAGNVDVIGDMLKSIYDPNGIKGDAFNMDNMRESTNSKIFTADERNKLRDLESDKSYRHSQNIPSTSWEVTHNLNKYPSITISDSAGTIVEGEVSYISKNQLIITFSAGFSGFADLN